MLITGKTKGRESVEYKHGHWNQRSIICLAKQLINCFSAEITLPKSNIHGATRKFKSGAYRIQTVHELLIQTTKNDYHIFIGFINLWVRIFMLWTRFRSQMTSVFHLKDYVRSHNSRIPENPFTYDEKQMHP